MNIDDVEYLPPPQQQRVAPRRGRGFGTPSMATLLTPSVLSTPEDLRAAADQTNDFINAMSDAVAAQGSNWPKTVPKGTGKLFDAFRKHWSDFYGTDLSANWRSLVHLGSLTDQLKNAQEQACAWAANLKKWGVPIPGVALPACAAGDSAKMLKYVGIGAIALVGLFIIGKLVHTVAFGGAELEDAEDEALKIAEAKKRKKHDRHVLSIT